MTSSAFNFLMLSLLHGLMSPLLLSLFLLYEELMFQLFHPPFQSGRTLPRLPQLALQSMHLRPQNPLDLPLLYEDSLQGLPGAFLDVFAYELTTGTPPRTPHDAETTRHPHVRTRVFVKGQIVHRRGHVRTGRVTTGKGGG